MWRRLLACLVVCGLLLAGGSAWAAKTLYIPHLTGNEYDSWGDSLVFTNLGKTQASYTLILYASGQQVATSSGTVAGFSEAEVAIAALSQAAECGVVTVSADLMDVRLAYSHTRGKGVAEFRLDNAMATTVSFLFSGYSSQVQWKGIALSNLSAAPVTATLYAIGGGSILGQTSQVIAAHDREHGLYQRWFPQLPFGQIEAIVAVAPAPVLGGIVISGTSLCDKLLFTKANPLTSFSPGTGDLVNLSGSWQGSWQSTQGGTGSVSFLLNQNLTAATGTVTATGTDCGTMTNVPMFGTITGPTNALDMTAITVCTGASTVMRYTGTAPDGQHMSGAYTIHVNGNPYDAGTWNASKL